MSQHILPASTYYKIFGTVIALTLLTVGLSFVELGKWHAVAGLTIALCKAALVALFFMHLLHSKRLIGIVLGAALFWLAILMTLTLADYLTRPWLTY